MSLDIIIWDVKHGSAVYIITPNKKRIVVDLGVGKIENGYAEFSPSEYLSSLGVRIIDELIITHPDLDHISDIINFCNSFSIKNIRLPKKIPNSEIKQKIYDSVSNNRFDAEKKFVKYMNMSQWEISNKELYKPEQFWDNGGVNFELFFPTPKYSEHICNDYSIVTVISFRNKKIILTGDNEKLSWDWLLSNKRFINTIKGATILFASHHGRKSGYCERLFNFIKPKVTIISDGPVKKTSITKIYNQHCKGLMVHNSGDLEKRKCLTTRKDGAIKISIKKNANVHISMKSKF